MAAQHDFELVGEDSEIDEAVNLPADLLEKPSWGGRGKFFAVVMLMGCVGLAALWKLTPTNDKSEGLQENDFLQLSKAREPLHMKPFEITPCDVKHTEKGKCEHKCGNVAPYTCKAKGWVFCQNAVCNKKPAFVKGKWVAECHCWQPDNTDESLLPVEDNSGANCVLDAGKGGKEMCDGIKNGELWSTYGPTGTFLPGLPLKTANCAPHTLWAWCWGAPCEKKKVAGGHAEIIICHCPVMKSMNGADQALSLAGDEQCPPDLKDPCNELSWTHNSMPAGASPSGLLPDSDANQCYDYQKAEVDK